MDTMKIDKWQVGTLKALDTAACSTSVPKAPEIRSQVGKHGRWWWFCDESTMKDIQPVLVGYEGKYDSESACYFLHPWTTGNDRWDKDTDIPKWASGHRYVRNWEDCFHGPCLYAPKLGMTLE